MIEVETPQEIEVISNGIDVEARSLDVEVVDLKELDVTVAKREFVITGDDIYVPKLYEDAPQWMKDLVQLVVNSAVDTGNASTLAQLTSMLSQFATSYVPLNQYTQSILDLSNADANIHSVIETLNSNYNNGLSQANAQIISLQNTKASKDEVVTQVVNTLAAQLANPMSSLGAAIGNLQQTIVDNQNANALSMQTLTASLEDTNLDVTANAEVIQNALAYVGIDEAGASTGTGLSAYLEDSNGNIGGADSQLANSIRVTAEGVESKFAYNSLLNINGVYKKSGFGLTTNYVSGSGTQVDPYVSEFWIDASRLKFTNSNVTGSVAPFTIDATGTTPQITFNGKVSFSNVTNVPQLGSTPQEVVTAINNAQTTTINGPRITTGSITASQIQAGSISADKIASYNITASNTTFGNSIIGTAQIQDASISNAKIADLSVDTIKLANQAVTIPISVTNYNQVGFAQSYTEVAGIGFYSSGAPINLVLSAILNAGSLRSINAKVTRDSTIIYDSITTSVGQSAGQYGNIVFNLRDTCGAGYHEYRLYLSGSAGTTYATLSTILGLEVKK